MTAPLKRLVLWSVIVAFIVAALIVAFWPQAVSVDVVVARPAPMLVTLDEEGETRVHDVFTLSAPVTGELSRINAHVGDVVVAGETVLASLEPVDPAFLDPRSEAQAEAAVLAAESARNLATARVERVAAELKFAKTDYQRSRTLISEGTITRREFDTAERIFKTSQAELATAQAALQMSSFELEQARALLLSPAETAGVPTGCACVELTAPVSGQVLRVINRSERVVTAGEPLIEIGDPADLEIVVDYLSADAVRIEQGQRVVIDNWGGATPLDGVVRRVEPFGFTKVSALGIEEQRVNVVIDFRDPIEQREKLGHGYQVETRVVYWEDSASLSVPLTALFRLDADWALFVAVNNRAELRRVTLGQSNGIDAAIEEGLADGDHVIVHPSDRVIDGVRISQRDELTYPG